MSATAESPGAAEAIEAPLTYLADDENLAVYIASVGGGEVAPHEGNYLSKVVTIRNGRARAEGRPRRRPLAGRYFRGNQLGNSPCEGTAGSWVTACGGGRGRDFGQYERLASDPWETPRGCSRIGGGRAVARDAPTSSAALRCPRVV